MKKFGLLVLSAAAVVMFAGDLSAMQQQGQGGGFVFKSRGREASLKHMQERRERQAAAPRSNLVQQEKINQLGQQRREDKKEIEELQLKREQQEERIKKLEAHINMLEQKEIENKEKNKEQIEELQSEIEKIKKSNYFRDVTASSSSQSVTDQ